MGRKMKKEKLVKPKIKKLKIKEKKPKKVKKEKIVIKKRKHVVEDSNGLSLFDKETIINFNKGDKEAYIFTYERPWQTFFKHKGVKPYDDDGCGGKSYIVNKDSIQMPLLRKKRETKKEKKHGNME
jgi:hypothetical protein